jgi:hypothetical protein
LKLNCAPFAKTLLSTANHSPAAFSHKLRHITFLPYSVPSKDTATAYIMTHWVPLFHFRYLAFYSGIHFFDSGRKQTTLTGAGVQSVFIIEKVLSWPQGHLHQEGHCTNQNFLHFHYFLLCNCCSLVYFALKQMIIQEEVLHRLLPLAPRKANVRSRSNTQLMQTNPLIP